ncbi:aldehyde ferredoxin oxidoreductase family protein [Pelotomaculum propionicicum]|uniref:Putative oxidoreductase YdhV n=1 Tax=Pelotomaculum propionicicum TaxID=258475 RepID=A0A4Y7RNF0_9FIRM|nr:aldehyde ferredoxin oxidoreductase family protein [Pelotomaculum propionicicum]TEB10326.1 putative oxidoreductase YdhV [Pelotomaculum propionicicum]
MTAEVPGGYGGKILRINLSEMSTSVERKDDTFYRRYLGGSGFISYFLLKELKKGIDPLGTRNKLVFANGPLTGTPVIACGRNGVGAKSPQSGGIALSQVGEFWGAQLKWAGYDALIIEGKAAKPVYIWIHDEEVSIRDAGHLWGKNTKETQQMIRSELGDDKIRVALIGPGGEKMVRYACIMNGLFDAAGRGGLGAVMGSKNLKAIAVRGRKAPRVADPARIKELNKFLKDAMFNNMIVREWHEYGTGGPSIETGMEVGDLPVRNFRDGAFPEVKKITGEVIMNTMGVGMDGCFACPVRCKKVCKSEKYSIDPAYGGPEYESLSVFGSNCGVDNVEAIVKANELCNAFSIDTIATGCTIAFAMECFEKGLLSVKDTGGIELRFGNAEAMLKCVELIAKRDGFGNLLAEGTAWLAKKIGNGAEDFAVHVKGVEPGQHDPRRMPSMGLGFMVNPHGADHCCNVHDYKFADAKRMKTYRYMGFLDTLPEDDIGPRKVALFKVEHLRQVLFDSLLMCHLAAVPVDHKTVADITAAVTGWDTSVMEQLRVAERIMTMARLFNIREGLTADDDRLPLRFFQPTTDGALADRCLDPDKMEKAKRYYYTLMGWHKEGVPLPEKVEELYIGE